MRSPRGKAGGVEKAESGKRKAESESSFFDNDQTFPRGSVAFDSAFLMRGIEHEWHAGGDSGVNREFAVKNRGPVNTLALAGGASIFTL